MTLSLHSNGRESRGGVEDGLFDVRAGAIVKESGMGSKRRYFKRGGLKAASTNRREDSIKGNDIVIVQP